MKKISIAVLLLCSLNSFSQLTISGNVWYDADYNYSLGMNEIPLINKTIKLQQLGSGIVYYVQTGMDGYFTKNVAPADYLLIYSDSYDSVNYQPADTVAIYDQGTGYEYGDIAFQPKVAQTFVGAYMYGNSQQTNLPAAGSTQQMVLRYAYTDISIMSMPLKVTLDFNPMVGFTGSSVPPSLALPGHLEWYFSSVDASTEYLFSNEADSIQVNFSFPAVGDTIARFELLPSVIPQVAVSSINANQIQPYYWSVDQAVVAAGVSTGVKWLYAINTQQGNYHLPYLGKSIDTAYTGDGYYILSSKSTFDTTSHNYVIVSKLGKDGLPVWEKQLSKQELNGSTFDPVSITAQADGGCTIFSYTYNSDSASSNKTGAFRLDGNGNILWQRIYSGGKYEEVYYSVNTADNGYLITGYATHVTGAPLGNNTDSLVDGNLFVAKIAANGDQLWRKEYGGSRDDAGLKIVNLSNGSFLVLGVTSSNDGDVRGSHPHRFELTSYYLDTLFNYEGWILNIDGNGNLLWNKCYGGSGIGYFSAAAESAGGILLAGFTNSKDGDLPYYPETGIPLWLLHISNNGSINWSKYYKYYAGYKDTAYIMSQVTDNEDAIFTSLSKTRDGNFVLAGGLEDKYGSIRSRHGQTDFLFIKIDPLGNLVWQKPVGGTASESINYAMADKNDDIIFTGESESHDDDLYGRAEESQTYHAVIGKIGITNSIKGQVYVDNNANNIKDANELFYSNGRIQSTKTNDTLTAYIFNGQFLNNADTGNYTTRFIPANNYYTVLPATHSSNFSTFDQTDIIDFALQPKPNINDLETQLIPISPARPGFETSYRIITKNVGTTTLNNVVISLKKDSRQSYVASGRPYSGTVADSLWWGPFTLRAFDADTLDVVLLNAVPTTLNNGDTLALLAIANPVVNDSSAANNRSSLLQPVRGSFDPNDKSELHGGQLTPLAYSNNEYLQYMVRFQNTGSDTAFFVTIKDTLDAKLDLTSLQVIAASHHYDFKMEKNVCTWQFKFIGLPDSTTNEAASHGYILFKIKPKTGLSLGNIFSNQAAIYFDFNLPVFTNTEKTIISDGNGICPGGSIKYSASISGSSYQWQVNTGSGYTNISNNATYSGVNTGALQITAASTTMYGYKYRCVVNGTNFSAESQLKFLVTWTGAGDTNWQNPANWNCGVLPDAGTDVLIKTGLTNYPIVNNNVSCHSIRAAEGATILVKTGVQLNLTGR